MHDGPTTYIWERYGGPDDDEFADTGWTPRTSYAESMARAVPRYLAVLNEQFLGGNVLPKRLLAVEVGGHQQKAQEFEPRPAKVRLEEV